MMDKKYCVKQIKRGRPELRWLENAENDLRELKVNMLKQNGKHRRMSILRKVDRDTRRAPNTRREQDGKDIPYYTSSGDGYTLLLNANFVTETKSLFPRPLPWVIQ
jgi:hypothetical protein